jgi:AcrR family transcriptional regulator
MPAHREGDTKWAILNAALMIARDGLNCVTLRGVARRVGIDHRTVVHHFGALDQLRQTVAAEGLARGDGRVIARLILDKHPTVRDMPGVDRDRWLLGAAG